MIISRFCILCGMVTLFRFLREIRKRDNNRLVGYRLYRCVQCKRIASAIPWDGTGSN